MKNDTMGTRRRSVTPGEAIERITGEYLVSPDTAYL